MSEFKKIYKEMIRDEVQSAEVQKAKELFLRKNFSAAGPSPWKTAAMPVLRFAVAGMLVFGVMVKVAEFQSEHESANVSVSKSVTVAKAPQPAPVYEPATVRANRIEINKLASQVGPTVAYQKNFSDVQVTVLWVFPQSQGA